MKKQLWYSIPILFTLAVGGLVFFKGPSLSLFKTHSLVGQYLPKFNLPSIYPDEPPLTPQALVGRYTVLIFFASWCKYCQAQLPVLKELTTHPGLDVIGINVKDDPLELKKWLAKNRSLFKKIVSDPRGSLMSKLSIKGVPESFFIDPEGKIIFHAQGVLNSRQIQHGIVAKISPSS